MAATPEVDPEPVPSETRVASPAAAPAQAEGAGYSPNRRLEFDRETIPWLDKYYLEIQAYVDSLPPEQLPAYDLEAQLAHWMRFGYVTFAGAVDADLIDDYLADVDEFMGAPGGSKIKLAIENYGVNEAGDLPPEAFAEHHRRIMDFHNASTAGKQLALHPLVVEFLGHVFRERVIAMQSLTFDYGTEQPVIRTSPMSSLASRAIWLRRGSHWRAPAPRPGRWCTSPARIPSRSSTGATVSI